MPGTVASGYAMLPFQKAWLALNIIRLVLAVVVLGLTAYGLSVFALSGSALSLFTALATMGIAVYEIVAAYKVKTSYNYWAVLACEIFLWIFWVASFSLLAADAAASFVYDGSYCDDYYGYCEDYNYFSTGFSATMSAAAGIGALAFLITKVLLILTAVGIFRVRRDLRRQNVTGAGAPYATDEEKYQMQPVNNNHPTTAAATTTTGGPAAPSPMQPAHTGNTDVSSSIIAQQSPPIGQYNHHVGEHSSPIGQQPPTAFGHNPSEVP